VRSALREFFPAAVAAFDDLAAGEAATKILVRKAGAVVAR
jgi:hypothetical protein